MAHFWEFLDQFLHDAVKADGKKHWRQWIPLLNTGCAVEFTAVPKDGWVFSLALRFLWSSTRRSNKIDNIQYLRRQAITGALPDGALQSCGIRPYLCAIAGGTTAASCRLLLFGRSLSSGLAAKGIIRRRTSSCCLSILWVSVHVVGRRRRWLQLFTCVVHFGALRRLCHIPYFVCFSPC